MKQTSGREAAAELGASRWQSWKRHVWLGAWVKGQRSRAQVCHLTWTSGSGSQTEAPPALHNSAGHPAGRRSAPPVCPSHSPPPGQPGSRPPADTSCYCSQSKRQRAGVETLTCRVKHSAELQVTVNLTGSSSWDDSAEGGRGLSSTHSSDWLKDSRLTCVTS